MSAAPEVSGGARQQKYDLKLIYGGPIALVDDKVTLNAEVGRLPARWHEVRLGDIARVLYGKACRNHGGTIPVVGSGGIFGSTAEPLMRYETMVTGRKGAAGSVFYCPEPCYPSDTTFYVQWLRDVHVPYVYYEMRRCGLAPDRSVIPSLARADAENYRLLLPPLPEQRAIARVLRAVQDTIAARRCEVPWSASASSRPRPLVSAPDRL